MSGSQEEKTPPSAGTGSTHTCCKGVVFYAGMARSKGELPTCLGVESLLHNVNVIEEDAEPPPPKEAKFIFVGVGVSVYSKELLSRDRLPPVNGFTHLVMSNEHESSHDKTTATEQKAQRRSASDTLHDNNTNRKYLEERRQRIAKMEEMMRQVAKERKEKDGLDGLPENRTQGSVTTDDHGEKQRNIAAPSNQQEPRRPQRLSPEELSAKKKEEREEAKEELRAQLGTLVESGRARVEVQFNRSVELARVLPEKFRSGAERQAAKTREMPGMMVSTARRGYDLGASVVKYVEDKVAERRDDSRGGRK